MHIQDTQIQKVFELHMHKVRGAKAKPAASASKPDQLTLSSQAAEMQNVKQFVSGLPDVRQGKVSDVKARIDSGAYQVSDDDVATAIFDSAVQGKGGI